MACDSTHNWHCGPRCHLQRSASRGTELAGIVGREGVEWEPEGQMEVFPLHRAKGLFGGLEDEEEPQGDIKEGACEGEEESSKRHPRA